MKKKKSNGKMNCAYELRKMERLFKVGSLEVQFVKLGPMSFGDIYIHIRIDHTKGDFIDTFVHEMFHALYPSAKHKKIFNMTRNFLKHSSWETKKKLIKFMLKCSDPVVNIRT